MHRNYGRTRAEAQGSTVLPLRIFRAPIIGTEQRERILFNIRVARVVASLARWMRAMTTHAPSPAARERRRLLREATSRRVSRWRARNSERQKALNAVAVAIKNSDLVREPCERCGTTKSVCADPVSLHPLRVKWRCRSCGHAVRREAARAMKPREQGGSE
jgi:hypothetical protein